MIQKARCSVMMEAGMKASGKMVKSMVGRKEVINL